MRTLIAAIAAGVLTAGVAAGSAQAGDLYYPAPPPAGDPIYGQQSVVGDLSLAAGVANSNFALAGAGRLAFDLGSGWRAMGEIAGITHGSTNAAGYGHIYTHMAGAVVGVFAGAGSIGGTGRAIIGIEGAIESNEFVLGGNLAYYTGAGGFAAADLWVAYYLTPDTKLRGDFVFSGASGSGAGIVGGIYHRFAGTPVVGFGRAGVFNSNAYALVGGTILFNDPGTTLRGHYREAPFRASLPLHF